MGLGILIGILITIVIGLSAFIIYDKLLTKNDNIDVEHNELDSNSDSDADSNNNNYNNNNVNGNNNSSANQNTTILKDFDISKFDTKKEAINGPSGSTYKLVTNDTTASNVGLSIQLNDNKKSATITIDWLKYFETYGISVTTGETRKYNITNFTKNIKEVYIGGFGQASGYETAFYVMEDGTVEYTPIKHALGNDGSSSTTVLKSYGKIENVDGIVKVVTATDYCVNTNCVGDGAYNILGIKSDGTFYNLSIILYETNYYSF